VLTSLGRTSSDLPPTLLNGPKRIELPPEELPSLHITEEMLVVWQPVQAGNTVGWLNISYGLEDISALQRQIWKKGFVLSIFEIIGGVLLVFFLVRRPLNSIKTLSVFARGLPRNRGITIPVDRFVAEIEDLGESLNYASTELARVERELRQLNQTLETRIEDEVAKSREKDLLLLQQARYQTMGELLVNIAHHWRQPLNSVGASIQDTAYQIASGEMSPDQATVKATEVMHILKQLSDSIEGFRQLCQPVLSEKQFMPSEAVSRATSLVAESYRQRGISINVRVESEAPVKGAMQELIQCILNLLNNASDAIEANRIDHGWIEISLRQASKVEQEISIVDNAGGIKKELLATMFDPYVTTKFRSQSVGLGLFVVRQIVELHFSGRVTAANLDTGAVLKIFIPSVLGGDL
jgi:signal transduction histidine kinase